MILFVSTLSPKEGDLEFFDRFEKLLNHEPVVYWGGSIPGDRESRKFPLPWTLADLPRTSYIKRRREFKGVNAEWKKKYSQRLDLMAGQNIQRCLSQETIDNLIKVSIFLLTTLRPRLLIAHNPLIPHTGIPFDLAKILGIHTLTIERGPLPSTIWLDKNGYGGWSQYCGTTLEMMFPTDDHSELELFGSECMKSDHAIHTPRGATIASQSPSKEPLPIPTSHHRILVVGMADVNTAIFPSEHSDKLVNSPHFKSSAGLALEVAKCSVGTVVFKPHPNCYHMSDMSALMAAGVFVSGKDITELLDWADIVITNGSSLEFQALAMNKPLVLAGRTVVTGKGIAYEVSDNLGLKEAIASAIKREDEQLRTKRFKILIGGLIKYHFIDSFASTWPQRSLKQFSGGPRSLGKTFMDYIRILKAKHYWRNESFPKTIIRHIRSIKNSSHQFKW